MEVALATVDDADAIASVKAAGWRSTYAQWVPAAVLEPLLDHGAQVAGLMRELTEPANVALVARRHDLVVGFATCLGAGRDEPLLDSFHVLPEARGQGVGAALLRRLAEELESRGVSTLVVAVVEQNTRTRGLYERLGAQYVTTAPAPWAPEHVREAHYRWADLAPLRSA